jgi:predicted MFS family arabinose efflux permease
VEVIVNFQHLRPSAAVAAGWRTTVSRMEAQAVAVVVMTLLREPVQQDKETQAAQELRRLAAEAAVLVVLVLPGCKYK